jgi:hypothetical protein
MRPRLLTDNNNPIDNARVAYPPPTLIASAMEASVEMKRLQWYRHLQFRDAVVSRQLRCDVKVRNPQSVQKIGRILSSQVLIIGQGGKRLGEQSWRGASRLFAAKGWSLSSVTPSAYGGPSVSVRPTHSGLFRVGCVRAAILPLLRLKFEKSSVWLVHDSGQHVHEPIKEVDLLQPACFREAVNDR